MENYGISKQQWLEEFLALPNGIPSDDTFRRVFEFIDPEALNRCFLRWVETLITKMGGEIIPIDGKTMKGSYDRNQGKGALHVISAWASEQRLVLAQVKVEDKSNEITAIPALLELLDITGAIITEERQRAEGSYAEGRKRFKGLPDATGSEAPDFSYEKTRKYVFRDAQHKKYYILVEAPDCALWGSLLPSA